MKAQFIRIRGAREHNLKNLSLEIPKGGFIVVTGPSGCGKSSLAYHTLYAEGQRRYLESLSAKARQYLSKLDKPDVDSIDGLSPSLALDQHSTQNNPRSLVATVTEIHDYLRLLYAAIGIPHDPQTGQKLQRMSSGEIAAHLASLATGTRLILLAPLPESLRADIPSAVMELQRQGFLRFRRDGELMEGEEIMSSPPAKTQQAEVVVDRIIIREGTESRLADSIETALRLFPDEMRVLVQEPEKEPQLEAFFTRFHNPETGYVLADLSPKYFSFNSPWGSCPVCHGLGHVRKYAEEKLIPDPSLSISGGAVKTWLTGDQKSEELLLRQAMGSILAEYALSPEVSWNRLPPQAKQNLIDYLVEKADEIPSRDRTPSLQQRLSKLTATEICPACHGRRLKPESLAITLSDREGKELNIAELLALNISEAWIWTDNLSIPLQFREVCEDLQRQITRRLEFLHKLGLGYLALDRPASTLSGGEAQRVRLASQLGGGLSGVLYVLDEPTIGLHPQDNERLIDSLRSLTSADNTVLVVEHDESVIRAADTVIDMGPGAGQYGGEILAIDSPSKLSSHPESLTGQWLSKKRTMTPFPKKRLTKKSPALIVRNPTEHNLKGQDVRIPLSALVCLTGPSGSGKSTLLNDIIYPVLAKQFHRSSRQPGRHDGIDGLDQIGRVVLIDQSPLGKSPRSNPATAVGILDQLRPLFAQLPLSRQRGYTAARFSFNRPGGRCDKCEGTGYLELDMNFLSDVYIQCDSCHGKRFNRETLEVSWRGRNIAEVLSMTVEEAFDFFREVPKIKALLEIMNTLGLGYLRLDQSAHTLSGGEAQRIKLASELGSPSAIPSLYLLDEPTTGLHFGDVDRLLTALIHLRDKGHSLLCIEHHPDFIRSSDWVIDLGPVGGEKGGYIVAEGTPDDLIKNGNSVTGPWLL